MSPLRHPALLLPDWPAPPVVRACSTLRHGAGASLPPFAAFNLGNCSSVEGDDPAVVARNRQELQAIAGLPAAPNWLRQVHGTGVLRLPQSAQAYPARDGGAGGAASPLRNPGDGNRQADAAVTAEPGCVLAILTADCLPVLFCADDGSEIAAAHAGWRGLAAGVLEATVAAMTTPAARLLAWLGPAAGPAVYEVGDEVRAAFVAVDAAAVAAFVATRPGHWRVDLAAIARQRLAAVGLTRVYGGGHCTLSDPARFFSHRRDGRSGRMASVIWIET